MKYHLDKNEFYALLQSNTITRVSESHDGYAQGYRITFEDNTTIILIARNYFGQTHIEVSTEKRE